MVEVMLNHAPLCGIVKTYPPGQFSEVVSNAMPYAQHQCPERRWQCMPLRKIDRLHPPRSVAYLVHHRCRTHRKPLTTLFDLTRKGLGISSLSGSQTGTGERSRSNFSLVSLIPLPTSMLNGRPPARACASSTRVLPPLLGMLRCMAAL